MNSEINDIFDLIKKRNFFEAKKKCSEVLSQNTNNSEFFNLFAIILFQLKEYNESIDKWKRALEINPKYFFGGFGFFFRTFLSPGTKSSVF